MATRPKIIFEMESFWVKLSDLKLHPKNPRKDLRDYPERFESLKKSLEVGVFESIKISKKTGFCLAGNQRIKAYEDLGYDEVPAYYVLCETEAEEIEIVVKDNNQWGYYDFDLLNKYVQEAELSLKDLGLDDFDLKALDKLKRKSERDLIEDDVPTLPETPPIAQYGDIYQLGAHRLMCGDSAKLDDVELLMNGVKADIVFTDPPYNVDYKGSGKNTSNKIKNDHMSPEDFRKFLDAVFLCYRSAVKKSAPFYICHSSSSQRAFEDSMEASGLRVRSQIIWNKTLASMGWSNYRWKHEPIFYAGFDGESMPFYGDRCSYTVWNESWSDEKNFSNLKKVCEKQEKGGTTIWTLPRDQNYVHPTQKPIQLIERALTDSSKEEDIVLDLFGGSGSTLIGAEKMGRVACLMELDPKYVDVIIARWENYSGEKAIKL